jgi:hypothetical protein
MRPPVLFVFVPSLSFFPKISEGCINASLQVILSIAQKLAPESRTVFRNPNVFCNHPIFGPILTSRNPGEIHNQSEPLFSGARQLYWLVLSSRAHTLGAAKSELTMARPAFLQLFRAVRHPEIHRRRFLLIIVRDASSLFQQDSIRLSSTPSHRLRSDRRIQFKFALAVNLWLQQVIDIPIICCH